MSNFAIKQFVTGARAVQRGLVKIFAPIERKHYKEYRTDTQIELDNIIKYSTLGLASLLAAVTIGSCAKKKDTSSKTCNESIFQQSEDNVD